MCRNHHKRTCVRAWRGCAPNTSAAACPALVVLAVQDNLLTSFNILKVGCPMLAEQGEKGVKGKGSSSSAGSGHDGRFLLLLRQWCQHHPGCTSS